jgi:hypothetical protein
MLPCVGGQEQGLNLGILELDDLLLTLIHARRTSDTYQVQGQQDEIHVAAECSNRNTSQHPGRVT